MDTGSYLWARKFGIGTSVLLVVTALLRLLALVVAGWASRDTQNQYIVMSLTECTSCPSGMTHWSWDCLKGHFCDSEPDLANCELFTAGYKASFAVRLTQYLVLECASLFLYFLLCGRMFTLALEKHVGPHYVVYTSAVGQFVLHLGAVVVWFAISNSQFQDCGDTLCANTGMNLSIAGLVSNLFTVISVCVYFRKRKSAIRNPGWKPLQGKTFCLSTQWGMTLVLFLQFVVYGLVLWSISTPRWVKRDLPTEVWDGGLLRCQDCPFNSQRVGWDCFAGWACDQTGQSEACVLYSNLRDAGRWVSVK